MCVCVCVFVSAVIHQSYNEFLQAYKQLGLIFIHLRQGNYQLLWCVFVSGIDLNKLVIPLTTTLSSSGSLLELVIFSLFSVCVCVCCVCVGGVTTELSKQN